MGYKLLVPPASEPVTLDQVKEFCSVDAGFTDHDQLLGMLARAAREWCENWPERYFVTQTWRLYLDAFPGYVDARSEMARSITQVPTGAWFLIGTRWAFALPFPPCQQVVQLQYLDPQGNTQTMTQQTQYVVDLVSEPARVMPSYGLFWPVSQFVPNAVWCDFVCGYDTVPEDIQIAILMLTLHNYDNRDASAKIPDGVTMLLSKYKDWRF